MSAVTLLVLSGEDAVPTTSISCLIGTGEGDVVSTTGDDRGLLEGLECSEMCDSVFVSGTELLRVLREGEGRYGEQGGVSRKGIG